MELVSPVGHLVNDDAVVGDGVQLRDGSLIGKLQVEGDSAESVLTAAFGAAPSENGGVVAVDSVMVGRIRPNRYLLVTVSGAEAAVAEKIEAAAGEAFITVSTQTQGQAMFAVSGPNSVALLSKLCGLDFDEAAFPVYCVKISSVAKIRATIWRTANGYELYCMRSYATYLWQTILPSR